MGMFKRIVKIIVPLESKTASASTITVTSFLTKGKSKNIKRKVYQYTVYKG